MRTTVRASKVDRGRLAPVVRRAVEGGCCPHGDPWVWFRFEHRTGWLLVAAETSHAGRRCRGKIHLDLVRAFAGGG